MLKHKTIEMFFKVCLLPFVSKNRANKNTPALTELNQLTAFLQIVPCVSMNSPAPSCCAGAES